MHLGKEIEVPSLVESKVRRQHTAFLPSLLDLIHQPKQSC